MTTDGLPDPIPAPDMDRREYAALPQAQAGRLRRAWRALAEPRATAPNGAPFPLRSWPPDAAIDIQALAEWVDPMKPETVRRFANTAARDAAIPAPAAGMASYLIDTRGLEIHDGAHWQGVTDRAAGSGSYAAAPPGAAWISWPLAAGLINTVGRSLTIGSGQFTINRAGMYEISHRMDLGISGDAIRLSGSLLRQCAAGEAIKPAGWVYDKRVQVGFQVNGSGGIPLDEEHLPVGIAAATGFTTVSLLIRAVAHN